MEEENSLGLMGDHMKANTTKIKSKAKEYTLGLMGGVMTVIG